MAKFVPIDPAGKTDRELIVAAIEGIQATHSCIDTFRLEQGYVNKVAIEKREEIIRSVTATQGVVADLKTQQDIDGGRITKLSQLFGAEKVEPGERKPKAHSIAAWGPLKAAAALGGLIAGLGGLYKLVIALAPALYGVLLALHRYLLVMVS